MKPNLNNVSLKVSAGLPKQFPADRLPQTAFSGRSNVGKSSLINSLLGRKSLARVSGEPGKTITLNFYDIDRKMYLVDLPGYGYAKRTFEDKQKWSALTDGYFTNNKNIDSVKLICQLVDSRTGPTEDDYNMLYYMREAGLPHILVATKTDKLNATERNKFLEIIADDELTADLPLILYSAKTNAGREDLWRQIYSHCNL
ncbi:MAG: YihA family ribosome biogenesis GTP-binding protein [Clostridia bacterium]|nr:YihA family ribosome biogenesis GTP-binding protein [Oscillospiraceae bacterium]MBO4932870.1 YihA family ribosome biogenesis GTP-binding protein [Clostridia bacterium]MBP3293239.1 YihA family ribosome biogenesis GTP-binding protein [Clostridia bacterium]